MDITGIILNKAIKKVFKSLPILYCNNSSFPHKAAKNMCDATEDTQ